MACPKRIKKHLNKKLGQEIVKINYQAKNSSCAHFDMKKAAKVLYYGVWRITIEIMLNISRMKYELYKLLPLRLLSRFWGYLASLHIPVRLRSPILGIYVYMFSVNMHEALEEDLKSYECLTELFSRRLKSNTRLIEGGPCVSPCDGLIVSCGKVKSEKIDKIKGLTYNLNEFLGKQRKFLLRNEKNCLYQMVVYLAPGDYHRFHSPCDFSVASREHFPGKLLSVSPWIVNLIPGLFCMNERVVYCGEWLHGFFSMTAVGATNVGSIHVYCDSNLKTNDKNKSKNELHIFDDVINVKKGDLYGHFSMGSTIVMVFEAPKDVNFLKKPGDRLQVGENILGEV